MDTDQSGKGDILIVDDTPDNLRFLATLLSEKGYEVRGVTSGSAALMGVQAQPPDLILMDIVMPMMTGYDVCQHLQANPVSQDIPVIFISALNETFDKVRAFAVGGVDYITKPFQAAEVLARIENHLARRQLQVQLMAALEREKALNQQIKELAVWSERMRIAREMHDSLGHVLVALNIQLETALALWADQPDQAHTFLQEAKQQGTEALQAVRQSVANMRSTDQPAPVRLESAIAKLIQDFHRTTQLQPQADIQLLRPVPPQVHETLYRLVQEGLTNICKHAQATAVQLTLQHTADTVMLTLQDNGQGFDMSQSAQGFGLMGMQERVTDAGGCLTIHSKPGQGCQITATFVA